MTPSVGVSFCGAAVGGQGLMVGGAWGSLGGSVTGGGQGLAEEGMASGSFAVIG